MKKPQAVQLGAFLRTTLPLGLDALADYDSALEGTAVHSHRRMLKRISTTLH